MGLAGWLELIKGVLQFPDKVLQLVRYLQKTPTEKHDEIMKRLQEEQKDLEDGARPSWD